MARVVEANLERKVAADLSGRIDLLLHCIGMLPERFPRVVRAGLEGG